MPVSKVGAGIPIAATPFPISSFWLRSQPELQSVFWRLYPHAAGHSLSRLYGKGRVALSIWLQQLEERRGKRKVILPAYAAESLFYATIAARLQIVLCEVDLADTLFDLSQLDEILRRHGDDVLAAIIPYNWGVINLEKARSIHDLLTRRGIMWVDDFAQTQPIDPEIVEYFNRNQSISLYSFTGTKILSCQHGGLLTFSNDIPTELQLSTNEYSCVEKPLLSRHTLMEWMNGERRKKRALYRREGSFGVRYDMYPTSLTVLRVVLSRKWERLLAGLIVSQGDGVRQERMKNNGIYRRLFQETAIQAFAPGDGGAVGARYMVLFPSEALRDRCQQGLFEYQFWTSRGYVHSIPHVDCIRPYLLDEDKDESRFPNAKELERRLLTFPNHYLLRKSDFDLVGSVIEQLHS
ncbi:MAG: DegT/DnrJ/EryC1/StrS family aminotransferase [Chloroflexi bacterium]|nr:DegT/DnrJ/EryC1/StrS family aminotransferase [Chloroflexota bacterium]